MSRLGLGERKEDSSDESRIVDQEMQAVDDVERRGLLSGQPTEESDRRKFTVDKVNEWIGTGVQRTRGRLSFIAAFFAMLLLGGTLSRHLLLSPQASCNSHPNMQFTGTKLRSNGTHDYKRTVVIVSIDGLRADYLERGLTPHLLDLSSKGLRARYMKPIFPTLTFPNHWALMTGLYAESHGIVANDFWDPKTQSQFHYNKPESALESHWWGGEPMWETTTRASMKSANLMWPGPARTTTGATATYFVPWKDKVPLSEKLEQITQWLDLPLEERPQLITVYEPSLDQAGHQYGPNSKPVNDTLKVIDGFAKNLHSASFARNLTEIVDVIFVSDHGMTDTSHPEPVFIDDILGEDAIGEIEHFDGWPSMGLRFSASANTSYYLSKLQEAASANSEKFHVYTHETMPNRYHFADNNRIAPIYVVPEIGYVLTLHKEGDVAMSKGNHGYDNDNPTMFASFIAHGPFATNIKDVYHKRSASLTSKLLPRKFTHTGWDEFSHKDRTYVIQGFQNVQIYGLVMKLLGIEEWSARNNATIGFWDRYF